MTDDRRLESIVQRLTQASNDHDLDALVALFAEDYRGEQPLHPNLVFIGREGIREHWSMIFANVPDFHVELVRWAGVGDTLWQEVEWTGSPQGGEPTWMCGVVVLGVEDDLIAWGRLYVEPVAEVAGGISYAEYVRRGVRAG